MIEARSLTKRYGSTAAVSDLSFTIRPGIVTGFLGPNGAGKTTTMRMILGLDYPTAGTVTIGGVPYARLAYPMREVGALLEARAVNGGRTARSHLLSLAQTNDISRRRVDALGQVTQLSKRPLRVAVRGADEHPGASLTSTVVVLGRVHILLDLPQCQCERLPARF